MIDLHSHILARLDDGPGSPQTSLAMAVAWVRDGVTTVAATPHVNLRYQVEAPTVAQSVRSLNTALAGEGIALSVLTGGEIALERLPRLDDEALRGFALGGADCLLVESPFDSNASYLEEAVFDLQLRGFRVLLAHPERSPLFQRDPDRLRSLVRNGALCSVTSGSMAGRFGGSVREFTVDLFEEGLVHNVASDAHDDDRRPPGLRDGFTALESDLPGLADRMPWFTEAVPAALVEGRPLRSSPPALARRHGRWRLLSRHRSQS